MSYYCMQFLVDNRDVSDKMSVADFECRRKLVKWYSSNSMQFLVADVGDTSIDDRIRMRWLVIANFCARVFLLLICKQILSDYL